MPGLRLRLRRQTLQSCLGNVSLTFVCKASRFVRTMSTLHLGAGSVQPAPVEGKARLYSMKYCPFSHRARLILTLKQIPHDIVNINLSSKPEWYTKINPNGKVPTFVDVDGKVVDDSMVIANYLNNQYPEPPLYRAETKACDLELIDGYGALTSLFGACIHGKDKRPLEEIMQDLSEIMIKYEEEFQKRGTAFFGGDKIGMLDIIMWPWMERVKAIPLIYDQHVNFDREKFPNLIKWAHNMKQLDAVQSNAVNVEDFAKIVKGQNSGEVDYDNV